VPDEVASLFMVFIACSGLNDEEAALGKATLSVSWQL